MKRMPLWVALAFASIPSRKMALYIVFGCAAFTAYCFPWSRVVDGGSWIAQAFVIDDWTWFAGMVPTTLWYWLSLRWIDNHASWGEPA